MSRIPFIVALAMGVLVAYVDTRPGWDDTGVTAGALFVIAAVLGFLRPARPWHWTLALGIWIPLRGIIQTQSFASILALVVTFVGAYVGAGVQTVISPARR